MFPIFHHGYGDTGTPQAKSGVYLTPRCSGSAEAKRIRYVSFPIVMSTS
jgi:hypothetical protein